MQQYLKMDTICNSCVKCEIQIDFCKQIGYTELK